MYVSKPLHVCLKAKIKDTLLQVPKYFNCRYTLTSDPHHSWYSKYCKISLHFGIGLSWACSLVFTTSKGVTTKQKQNDTSCLDFIQSLCSACYVHGLFCTPTFQILVLHVINLQMHCIITQKDTVDP